jgi:GNAT superfamily N-acetyltransferase
MTFFDAFLDEMSKLALPRVQPVKPEHAKKWPGLGIDLNEPYEFNMIMGLDRKPIGYSSYDPKKKEMVMLWVRSDSRRQGVATKLLQSHSGPVERLNVRRTNRKARKFYEKMGFEEVGPAPGNWGDRPFSVTMERK